MDDVVGEDGLDNLDVVPSVLGNFACSTKPANFKHRGEHRVEHHAQEGGGLPHGPSLAATGSGAVLRHRPGLDRGLSLAVLSAGLPNVGGRRQREAQVFQHLLFGLVGVGEAPRRVGCQGPAVTFSSRFGRMSSSRVELIHHTIGIHNLALNLVAGVIPSPHSPAWVLNP